MSEPLSVHSSAHNIEIHFGEPQQSTREFTTAFILDLDRENSVMGIEILNLQTLVGPNFLSQLQRSIARTDGPVRYSFDEEEDAFYLSLHDGNSTKQLAVDGTISINRIGAIVGLSAFLMNQAISGG